jgi:hypothetical protein
MLYLLSVILLVLCGLTFWLWRRAIAQRERLERALARVADPTTPEPEMLMTVRVLNPLEVARRESASARLIGDYMPETVRRMVFRRLTEELDDTLSKRGIESEISVEYR